jgi:hypothetical protein
MRDVEKGWDGLLRVWRATWWEWTDGSMRLFWRWPANFRVRAREVVPVHLTGTPPTYQAPQQMERNPDTREKVEKKLSKIKARRYNGPGVVFSLTSYFSVAKGEDDIWMVYDATKCGLNDIVWSLTIGLPTVNTWFRALNKNSYMMGDLDLGEIFVKFPPGCVGETLHGTRHHSILYRGRGCQWSLLGALDQICDGSKILTVQLHSVISMG